MKIAISLSGSIRNYERSLESLKLFAGNEVSVFIHTWSDIAQIQFESFSKQANIEPTDDIISRYNPASVVIEHWTDMRQVFWDNLNEWKSKYSHIDPTTNNIGMHGMFYSLAKSAERIDVSKYDVIVRLRFDCRLLENPFAKPLVQGWNIPSGNDFFGLNDQFAWFVPYGYWYGKSAEEASVYFNVYREMGNLIADGCGHGPEVLLKANFDKHEVPVNRPSLNYSIYR